MIRRLLNDAERHDWLRLTRAENVGAITFSHLLRRYGSAAAALQAVPELAARGGKRALKLPSANTVDDELTGLKKIGARLIALCEPDYPDALAALEEAPPMIAALGQPSLLRKRAIGIVGARNASLNGRRMAETLAGELGRKDLIVASGLARGIDTAAHHGSLATGTIAVLAGGVDRVYPEENRALYEKIAAQGCVISDMPLGTEPRAQLFPRRNRLISGLSLGVVVVEAALKSGSLITARLALEQGREVFAVPGSPLDPRCGSTNDLIRQGAILTESAGDVLSHIHALPAHASEPVNDDNASFAGPVDESDLAEAREIILENLGPSPVSIDDLIRESDLPAGIVLTVLLELELAGRIERQAGHRVALIGKPLIEHDKIQIA